MTRIDLVALQQRLAQQQPKPATPVRAEPPSWSTRPAPASALRTTPAPKACPVTASAAAPAGTLRATTPMRAALPLKATNARAERAEERARANALRVQIDELNAEMVVARAEADRALAEERQRVDRLNKQVEALSAEVVRAEKQAEALVGRAERVEAGRDAERAGADALRDRIAALQAQLAAAQQAAEQARRQAQAAQDNIEALREADAARKGRGRLARLRQRGGASSRIPARIGPVEFCELGGRSRSVGPHEPRSDHAKGRRPGEPGSRRWPIERRRIGPVRRHLQRTTDPLFRRGRHRLDERDVLVAPGFPPENRSPRIGGTATSAPLRRGGHASASTRTTLHPETVALGRRATDSRPAARPPTGSGRRCRWRGRRSCASVGNARKRRPTPPIGRDFVASCVEVGERHRKGTEEADWRRARHDAGGAPAGSQHANAKLAFGAADYLSIMSAPLTSVQWLVRAEDARLDAAAVNDPQVKRMMLVMAAGYERLAAHAVCLEQSGLPHEGARADFQLRGVRGTPRSW